MLNDILGTFAIVQPLKQAIRCGDFELTYEELFIMKERVKQYLVKVIHIQNGDKIAFYLPNGADFIYKIKDNHALLSEITQHIERFGNPVGLPQKWFDARRTGARWKI